MNSTIQERANPQDEILILGIGNPLMGDDGAGIHAVEMLANALAHSDIQANVRLEIAGLPGWGLPNWFVGQSSVMLVDAIDMQKEPGAWDCFYLHRAPIYQDEKIVLIQPDDHISLHQPNLASGLALAQNLDLLPKKLWLFGIQPERVIQESSLSPQVKAGLPGLVTGILKEIGNQQ